MFLHPDTQQEYALARSERKSGPGYRGFEISADPTITIEQDLLRRDLTINAIAEDDQGNIIDPYTGARISKSAACAMSPQPLSKTRCGVCVSLASPHVFTISVSRLPTKLAN